MGGMLFDDVKQRLRAAGFNLAHETRDGNDVGWRLRLDCNTVVNVYDSCSRRCRAETLYGCAKRSGSTMQRTHLPGPSGVPS
jgi:hypothetical protein